MSGSDQAPAFIWGSAAGVTSMTGQKDRYSTTEKLWKLDDEQLTTPKHDELVLMLLNKSYCFEKLGVPKENYDRWEIRSEVPITNGRGEFIQGYWDIVIGQVFVSGILGYYFVECKPTIDSFGKTLRQINTYKNNLDWEYHKNIFLFTPDIRFKDAFESQGIKVICP